MAADNNPAVSTSAGAETVPLSELKRLGKYQIEKKIGAGGMGAVYLARDVDLKRIVALKVLPRDKASNPTLVRRFRAEAQAAAQLRHENIVAVYDSGEADGYLYIAMEYVDGQDLFDMVSRRGVVPVKRSIEIIKQVASALQHAYEQSIVHRDIKPSNLLIRRDGVVKLTDLGLARSVDDTLETNITRAGTTVGTVDYMSPEQARNSKLADIRSDLYSLGCTWFQMLTGSPPYPDGSVTNKLQAHAIKPIPDPRDHNPRVPEGLTAVIRRMMAKKPEDRYQTPAELIEELNHATLTQSAIAREIFGGDDDDDAGDDADDEDFDDDDGGYIADSSAQTMEVRSTDAAAPTRRRSTSVRVQPNAKTPDGPMTSYKGSQRPSKEESDKVEASTGGAVSRAHRRDTSQSDRRDVSPPLEEADNDEPESAARRSKPRPGKSDAPETPSQGTSRVSDSKANKSKPDASGSHSKSTPSATNSKSPKPKNAPGKPLPPKMQPVVQESVDGAPFWAGYKEYLNYAILVAAAIAVAFGLKWLISSYGANANLTANPFEIAQGTTSSTTNIATVPTAVTGTSPETTEPEQPRTANTPSNAQSSTADSEATPLDIEKIPEWVGKDVDPAEIEQFTVGPGVKSATHFETLDDALQAAPSAGVAITLLGEGPFPIPRVDLVGRKYILISNSPAQNHPVVTLKPAEGQSTAGIKLSDGKLTLRGLHFVVERQVVAGPVKITEVAEGQLTVRRCSFTLIGTNTESAVAMTVASPLDATAVPRIEPRLLVDEVLVRGEGLGAIEIQRANLDAVIRNCLFVCGRASAIDVAGHVSPNVADVNPGHPRRVIRIYQSTISAHGRAFELAVDDGGKPPQTAILLRDSLCCTHGAAEGSTLAYVGRWPHVQSNAKGWLTRLSWISTNTLYLGFEQLLDLNSTYKVSDATNWQRVWNVKADSRQFQKLTFPDVQFDDLSLARPQDFDSKGLSYRDLKASNGGLPGCIVSQINTPDAGSQTRVQALTSRPALPAIALKPPAPAEVRRVDLKKEDLGTVLNRNDFPSGTLFEAFGGGLCFMSPARIEHKSLKIHFKQTEGTTLRMQPLQPKGADANKTDWSALITVTQGTLEMTNAALEGWPNSKGVNTDWLIASIDSTVVLNGCRLQGSDSDAVKQLGLIRWSTTVPGQPWPEPPALVCRDCYLATSGRGVSMEAAQGNLILRNSVLAVRGDALVIQPSRFGNALLPVVDAENITISASGAAIRFEAAQGADPVASPTRLYFDKCLFGPPLNFKAGESSAAALLRFIGPVLEQKQASWWGSSNGVARQVVYLIRRDDEAEPPTDDKNGLTAWRRTWDKAASVRMLTGEKGVYLASELPYKWATLKPGSFELHRASQAVTWADGGRAIGANVQAVETAIVARKLGAETPTPTVGTPNTTIKKPVPSGF